MASHTELAAKLAQAARAIPKVEENSISIASGDTERVNIQYTVLLDDGTRFARVATLAYADVDLNSIAQLTRRLTDQ